MEGTGREIFCRWKGDQETEDAGRDGKTCMKPCYAAAPRRNAISVNYRLTLIKIKTEKEEEKMLLLSN